MTETSEDARATTYGAKRPTPFLPVITGLYAVAWVLVMLQGWGARIGSDPTTWLYDPASTAARIVNRDLELAELLDQEGALGDLRRALYGTREEALDYALALQRDAVHEVKARVETGYETAEQLARCELRVAVLLAETGAVDEAIAHAQTIGDAEAAAAFRAIYDVAERKASPNVEPLERLAEAGLEDWLLERAGVHLLENSSKHDEALEIAKQVERRGARWLRRVDGLNAANAVLILLGIGIGIAWLRGAREGAGGLSVPWSASLGFAVIVRADFWNRLYFVVLAHAGETLEDPTWLSPFYTWGTLLASLPMLWLILRHLTPRNAEGGLSFFGAARAHLRLRPLLAIALAALAIDLLGTTALGWASWAVGFEGHWAEGLDETLIWGSMRELIETVVDYVVWTPLFEELMFRGLVYATLRTRLRAVPAAVSSAVFFSAIHFYSLPGFLMTFWSGFVWALAFERARSLLPGIVAHSIYNWFFVLGVTLVYR
ncbi:MAG: CPBP family intramembrane metalloprotease [Myxococcota bacterium]|jgi:membrane protease YdiL (CAAX protease family)|nr:CPBP family intramembrane metalloprotease [Myxococcota bacterium]